MTTKGVIAVKGLRTSGNRLSAGPGTLTEALNCFITSRDTLSTRRGAMKQAEFDAQYIDGDATDAGLNRAKELYQWGTVLLVSYSGSGGYRLSAFSPFGSSPSWSAVGSYTPPNPTRLRMKFAQLAQSLFWTTDAGPFTLDSVGGTARAAGVRAPFIIYQTDNDGGLYTRTAGNPNAAGSWLAVDRAVAYRAVIVKKNSTGVIVESAASPRVIVVNPLDVTVAIGGLQRSSNLVTATVAAHKFRVNDKLNLTLTGADIGNFNASNNVVTLVTSTTIVWAETAANYINVAAVTISSGTKSVQVVPATRGAAAGDFMQIYRTDEAAGEGLDPGDECYLAYERLLTAADVATGLVTIQDTTPSDFLGDPLDSNANSGEGLVGINTRPPLCDDLCSWDGRLWAGRTTDYHRLRLRLLGTGSPSGLQNGDTIAINTRAFTANTSFSVYTTYLPTENVNRTAHDIAYGFSSGLVGVLGSPIFDGDTGLGEVVFEQTTLASTMADGASGAISAIYGATTRTSAFADALATLKAVTSASTSRTTNVVTVRCVGHGFVVNQVVMVARNDFGAADANFPLGLKTVTVVVDADNFKYAETGSNATLSGASTYYAYATTYKSNNNPQPVRFSRPGIPEAWPLVNVLGGLPDGADVLRVAPSGSGYSLLVFLKDGAIYRVSGEYPYVVRRLDDTASLVAADSLIPHAGRLHGLTTQGICAITEAGVAILGADVEDITRVVVNSIMGGNLNASLLFAASYESERQYLLSMPQEVAGTPGITTSTNYQSLALNSLTNDYARESWQRECGLVFRGRDLLVMGEPGTNQLRVERKGLDGAEFCDARTTLTANGTQTSVSTIAIQSVSPVPVAGDILRHNSDYFLVTDGSATAVVISGTTSVTNLDSLYLYRSYQVQFTFTPDTGGAPGVEKRWREIQLHFGKSSIRTLTVTFTNEHGATGSVTSTDSAYAITAGTLSFPVGTLSTNVVRRIEVPHAVQRCAMLVITVTMQEAGNFFDLYGISATFENVSERTGK